MPSACPRRAGGRLPQQPLYTVRVDWQRYAPGAPVGPARCGMKETGMAMRPRSSPWRLRLALVTALLFAATGYGSWQAAVSLIPPPWVPEGAQAYQVLEVIDGDTVVARRQAWRAGEPDRVRYLGVDAPEMGQGEEAGQFFAWEATEANRQLVQGRRVWLVKDEQDRDEYGRLLAYVFADGVMVNQRLVAEGFAEVMLVAPNLRYAPELVAAQQEARRQGLGLWGHVRTPGPGEDLEAYVGQPVRLRAEVRSVAPGEGRRPTVLRLRPLVADQDGGDAGNGRPADLQPDVTALLYPESRPYFPREVAAGLEGQTVEVVGRLELRGGRLQMVLREGGQLQILGFTT